MKKITFCLFAMGICTCASAQTPQNITDSANSANNRTITDTASAKVRQQRVTDNRNNTKRTIYNDSNYNRNGSGIEHNIINGPVNPNANSYPPAVNPNNVNRQ